MKVPASGSEPPFAAVAHEITRNRIASGRSADKLSFRLAVGNGCSQPIGNLQSGPSAHCEDGRSGRITLLTCK